MLYAQFLSCFVQVILPAKMAVPFSNSKMRIPHGFQGLLEGIAKEILKMKPSDIYSFSAMYFENLLKKREGKILFCFFKHAAVVQVQCPSICLSHFCALWKWQENFTILEIKCSVEYETISFLHSNNIITGFCFVFLKYFAFLMIQITFS